MYLWPAASARMRETRSRRAHATSKPTPATWTFPSHRWRSLSAAITARVPMSNRSRIGEPVPARPGFRRQTPARPGHWNQSSAAMDRPPTPPASGMSSGRYAGSRRPSEPLDLPQPVDHAVPTGERLAHHLSLPSIWFRRLRTQPLRRRPSASPNGSEADDEMAITLLTGPHGRSW